MNTGLQASSEETVNGQICHTVRMIFAERLTRCRKKAKMTQKALADVIGVSKVTIEKWEYGEREISLKHLVKISETLDVPVDYLLGRSEYDGTLETISMNDRARNILAHAQKKGEEHSFLFEITFRQYLEQLAIMEKLHDAISENGVVITRVNVKGGENLIAHPAIKAYHALSTLSNDTEKLLISMYENPLGDSYRPDAFDLF